MTEEPLAGAVGRVLSDEVDMWARGGNADWTGSWPGIGEICGPREPGLWLHRPARTAQGAARADPRLQQLRERRDFLGRRRKHRDIRQRLPVFRLCRQLLVHGPQHLRAERRRRYSRRWTGVGTRKMQTRSKLRLDGQQASFPDPAGDEQTSLGVCGSRTPVHPKSGSPLSPALRSVPPFGAV